ncbi:hypothetical protein UFOVP908_185 [uncultured Caudovirales phage]|jgi:hypothetical protein|uniref:Uncharacterized protein n=1 Tax=uncultured Caudovirales phage TaxID=2100421 RepID=A0A6J5QMX0_9CAUD|nr:hypothetical protein UFOVP908_185 [uncultured Caudovirales phage]CAB4177110.1 hypothetical protein UFOVP990_184 [uncultured Caudovirales phage]CAB4182318.1 hypothetical protein UFOVP1065_215 [uncultured Caudovirales phage]CAB4190844.1 hypothetical protein UFOVP1198_184 [uncultured Caudovirales phage]CAB4211193.1 hypothetical protein UFOVP1418_176 [uncultured Caudovirales phage]
MTSKTPFEIRLDLLNLAQSILNDKVWADRNRIERDYDAIKESCLTKNKQVPACPQMPSVEEDAIVELAKKLNDFVSNG